MCMLSEENLRVENLVAITFGKIELKKKLKQNMALRST
jgi:hypothetical protein